MWKEKIDEAIQAARRERDNLSAERRRELAKIAAVYDSRIEYLSTVLKSLEELKGSENVIIANPPYAHTTESAKHRPVVSGGEVTLAGQKKSRQFPVKEEVKKIIPEVTGEFSPRSLKDLLDVRFPGIIAELHPSSVHRALKDLEASKEIVKVGTGRYKNRSIKTNGNNEMKH